MYPDNTRERRTERSSKITFVLYTDKLFSKRSVFITFFSMAHLFDKLVSYYRYDTYVHVYRNISSRESKRVESK